MPGTGQRGTTAVSPMDRTGQIYRQQLREKAAHDEIAKLDVNDVAKIRREAFAAGYDAGFDAGVEGMLKQLREAGLDLDEMDAEDAEPGEDGK